jgi:hypothetical protein
LLLGSADPGGWQRDVSASITKLGDVRLAAHDRAGALLAYEGSLAIRRKLAAALNPARPFAIGPLGRESIASLHRAANSFGR